MYCCYKNAIIKSERGGKIGKLPQIARTRLLWLCFFLAHEDEVGLLDKRSIMRYDVMLPW